MGTTEKPTLDEVKASIRAQHDALRVQLDTLRALARGGTAGDPASHARTMTDAVWSLLVEFDKHVGREEVDFYPYVAELEGEQRVSELRREHAQQRSVLLAMVSDCDANTHDRVVLAEDAQWLADSLQADMQREDVEIGSLSEDGYVADQCSG